MILFILDVREPPEIPDLQSQKGICSRSENCARVHELDSSREIVAHCRSGKRSDEAVGLLRKAGSFRKILTF